MGMAFKNFVQSYNRTPLGEILYLPLQVAFSVIGIYSYAQALIYIAKSLVVVVVSSKRVVKPLSRQAVVQPEVLHFLEFLLGHRTILGLGSSR